MHINVHKPLYRCMSIQVLWSNMTGQAQTQKIKTGVNTFPKKYVNINAVGKTINGKAGSYSIKMIKINGKLQLPLP